MTEPQNPLAAFQQREAIDSLIIAEEARRRKAAELMLQQAHETIQRLTAEIEALKPKPPAKDKKP